MMLCRVMLIEQSTCTHILLLHYLSIFSPLWSVWEAISKFLGGCPNLFSGDLPGFAKGCLCIIMRALEVELVRIPYVISTPDTLDSF